MKEFSQKTRSFIYPENYHLKTDQTGQMEINEGSFSMSLGESKQGYSFERKNCPRGAQSCSTRGQQ